MKIIKSVKITNFQSHKNTLINFAGPSCLTVITGPSDSGKSAVIRAIRWLCYNTPQGSDFISVGEDKCVVSILFEGGTVVERIRTRGGVNRYTVNGEVFEGFGTNVPLEVQQATGIRKLQIGDMNFLLNLSEQLDGPFLGKSIPGSARAKVLGKLAGTEEIDSAGKEVGTDLYRAKRVQEGLEKDVETIRAGLDEYSWIPGKETQLAILQAIIERTKKAQIEKAMLEAHLGHLQELILRVSKLQSTLKKLAMVDEGLNQISIAEEGVNRQQRLVFFDAQYSKTQHLIIEAETSISRLKNLDVVEAHVSLAKENSDLSKRLFSLRSIYTQVTAQTKSQSTIVHLLDRCYLVGPLLEAAAESESKRTLLNKLCDEYENVNLCVLGYSRIASNLSGLGIAQEMLDKAETQTVALKTATEVYKKRVMISVEISALDDKIKGSNMDAAALEKEYLEFMSALGKCPTCGSDIHIEKIREVI